MSRRKAAPLKHAPASQFPQEGSTGRCPQALQLQLLLQRSFASSSDNSTDGARPT